MIADGMHSDLPSMASQCSPSIIGSGTQENRAGPVCLKIYARPFAGLDVMPTNFSSIPIELP
jgi:hypothetical protein